MKRRSYFLCILMSVFATAVAAPAQQTVARQWNEALLDAIRLDFARPTVHARNLFHTSIALYDAWAAYDEVAETYLLGHTVGGITLEFVEPPSPGDVGAARNETMSYATYRLLTHRFAASPGAEASLAPTWGTIPISPPPTTRLVRRRRWATIWVGD